MNVIGPPGALVVTSWTCYLHRLINCRIIMRLIIWDVAHSWMTPIWDRQVLYKRNLKNSSSWYLAFNPHGQRPTRENS